MQAVEPDTFIRECSVDDVRRLGALVLDDNMRESGLFKQADPVWRGYYALEEAKHLLVLGAFAILPRVPDGKLVGYSVVVLAPHHQNGNEIVAQVDAIFVQRHYRAGGLGMRLFKATEAVVAHRGVKRLMFRTSPHHPFTNTLQKQGYRVREFTLLKELR